MKYGIIVGGKVTEPVTIAPAHEVSPAAWLKKQMYGIGNWISDPTWGGWVLVSNDAVPGATYNGPGSSTNPVIPSPAVSPALPAVLSKTAFMDLCETAFGGSATGRARFGKIIKACAASADDEVRFVYERFQGAQSFDKARVFNFMTLLIGKGIALVDPQVSVAERTAINANWPES